jgi:hypothetical protein
MSQKNDIAFGTASEMTNHDLLQLYLDTKLERKGGYAVFDFENPNKTIFVELKSRRIKHDAYDTAIIGLNKVAFSDHLPEAEFWFAFCYSDGLYVIKYDKEVFDTLEVCHDYIRGPRTDAHNRPSSVVFIPISLLTKVDEKSLVDRPLPTVPFGVIEEKEEGPHRLKPHSVFRTPTGPVGVDDEKEEPTGLNGPHLPVRVGAE